MACNLVRSGLQILEHHTHSARMMPEDSVYGDWPASGEIDLAESRGNNGDEYADVGGRDSLISAMVAIGSTMSVCTSANSSQHWGPIPSVDAFWRTDGKHNVRRTDYSNQYYTYGLEWSEKYIFTYINSRLLVRSSLPPCLIQS